MSNLRVLFSSTGLFIAVYVILGIFVNTASPHLPGGTNISSLHSWIQYAISVFFWPLSFWHPLFTTGKWMP